MQGNDSLQGPETPDEHTQSLVLFHLPQYLFPFILVRTSQIILEKLHCSLYLTFENVHVIKPGSAGI